MVTHAFANLAVDNKTGKITAVYKLKPTPFGGFNEELARQAAARIASTLRSISPRPLAFLRVDSRITRDAFLASFPASAPAALRMRAQDQARIFEEQTIRESSSYLLVDVTRPASPKRAVESIRSWNPLEARISATSTTINPSWIDDHHIDQMDRIVASIASPVTASELVWLCERRAHGANEPSRAPNPLTTYSGPVLALAGAHDISLVDHNGKHTCVAATRDGLTTYHSFVVVTAEPDDMRWPGVAEYAARAEEAYFPVDMIMNCRLISAQDAKRRARHKTWAAEEQARTEQQGSVADDSRGKKAKDFGKWELDQLSESRDPRLRVSIVYDVYAESIRDLREHMEDFNRSLRDDEITTIAWPKNSAIDAYKSVSLSALSSWPLAFRDDMCLTWTCDDMAYASPAMRIQAGDNDGLIIGQHLSKASPIRLNARTAGRKGRAPSAALFGEPGAGKTLFATAVLAANAKMEGSTVITVSPKRTDDDHAVASQLGGKTIDLLKDFPAGSLDPLRFGAGGDIRYEILSDALLYRYRQNDPRRAEADNLLLRARKEKPCSASDLLRIVDSFDDEGASKIAAEIRLHVEESPIGRLILDDGTAPDLASMFAPGSWTTINLGGLSLPPGGKDPASWSLAELASSSVIKLLANALLSVAIRDDDEHVLYFYDEAWAIASGAHSKDLIEELLRAGRSHGCTQLFGSQRPSDLHSLKGLVSWGWIGYQKDVAEAAAELDFWDIPYGKLESGDPDPEDALIRFLREQVQGRGVLIDASDNQALMQVEIPQAILDAIDTQAGAWQAAS